MLSYILKQAGYAIGTACNGIEALKKVRSLSPDLVLLDLMLPELDGFAVCETLRRHADTAKLPVIMLTAVSGELGRLSGLDCGANDYITKPFSPKVLVLKVEALLNKQDSPRPV